MSTAKKSASVSVPSGSILQKDRQHRVVRLGCGGTLSFTLDVNALELSGEDRTFLFQIVDQLDTYEKAQAAKLAAASAGT